jgi:hypothetical protein
MRNVLIAIAGLAACAYPLAQQSPATSTGVVAGQVIDGTTKKPIGGAVVTISTPGPAPAPPNAPPGTPAGTTLVRRAAVISNADGRFVFRDLPAGAYVVTATRMPYAGGATGRRRPGGPSRTFTLAEGARVTDAVIPMWRMGSISGSVRDDRGEPAIGVSVWAFRRAMIGGRLELTFSGGAVEATDDRGHYRLIGLQPGSYVVMIRSTLQTAAVASVEKYRAAVTSGTTAALQRELMDGGALRMQTQGLVVNGWQVSVSIGDSQPLPGPNGTLLLAAPWYHGDTRSPSEATVITLGPGDERPGVNLTLPLLQTFRVAGVVTGPAGPLANLGVQLFPVTDGVADPVPLSYSTTDAAGRFALLGAPPGNYMIRARRVTQPQRLVPPPPPAAGGLPRSDAELLPPPVPGSPTGPLFAELPVAVGSAHVDNLALTLVPGARIAGHVIFEGAATPPPDQLQRISVSIRPLSGTVSNMESRVDAAGSFQTSGHGPGRYLLTATPPGPAWTLASIRVNGTDASDQAITLGTADIAGAVVAFTNATMNIGGTVRAADGGADTEATVVAYPVDVKAWLASGMSPRRIATATTSSSGGYQLRISIPGDYMVVAVPPEVAPDVDPEFIARFASSAVKVSIAAGESKTQPLTVSHVR